jgi:hypothetical protein
MDRTTYTFVQLATEVLPAHMERLRIAMAAPHDMDLFAERGRGARGNLHLLGREKDFHAAYVFLENGTAQYVGITRKLVSRLMDHVRGTDHYTATLAYSMAKKATGHTRRRSEAMNDASFMEAFVKAKEHLKSLQVAFVEIEDDLALYVFEVYASMELQTTGKWNSFRTH